MTRVRPLPSRMGYHGASKRVLVPDWQDHSAHEGVLHGRTMEWAGVGQGDLGTDRGSSPQRVEK